MTLPREVNTSAEVLNPKNLIIFTDADGTLLDHDTYSFDTARPALDMAKKKDIPIHLVTSKTFSETVALLGKLGTGPVPFTVENGSANFIPKGYFPFNTREVLPDAKIEDRGNYEAVLFGSPYEDVRNALKTASSISGVEIKGISDMTASEFAQITNLTEEEAKRAQEREFVEVFSILEDTPDTQGHLRDEIEKLGYSMTSGGRFHHILRGSSKSKAVKSMISLYGRKFNGNILTVGIGDSRNDIEFVELCDKGFFVSNPKSISRGKDSPRITYEPLVGPEGWNRIVSSLISI